MRRALLIGSCLLAGPVAGAESETLRELMGEQVYRESGVESLSAEQLRVLERWILDQAHAPDSAARTPKESGQGSHAETPQQAVTTAPAAETPPSREPARREPDETPTLIRSRIDGHFDGWRRNGTLFRLQNGQIWEQRQPGTFVTSLESPEVIIRENRFGHTMEVVEIGRKVHVRRVR